MWKQQETILAIEAYLSMLVGLMLIGVFVGLIATGKVDTKAAVEAVAGLMGVYRVVISLVRLKSD